MRKIYRLAAFVLSVLAAVSALAACRESADGAETDTEVGSYSGMPEYDVENIEAYVMPFEYTGRTVYAESGETAQEALWSDIVGGAVIISYPSEQVGYYAAQERAKYSYYASRDGIEYEELLSALGITEEVINERARALVKEDLVLEYIIKDADITLSDGEKQAYADKYAEKLTEIYGYDKEYILNNMTEQMYDAMLSDKAMEYLLLNNTVNTATSE